MSNYAFKLTVLSALCEGRGGGSGFSLTYLEQSGGATSDSGNGRLLPSVLMIATNMVQRPHFPQFRINVQHGDGGRQLVSDHILISVAIMPTSSTTKCAQSDPLR